jgi:hypothetical protein
LTLIFVCAELGFAEFVNFQDAFIWRVEVKYINNLNLQGGLSYPQNSAERWGMKAG